MGSSQPAYCTGPRARLRHTLPRLIPFRRYRPADHCPDLIRPAAPAEMRRHGGES